MEKKIIIAIDGYSSCGKSTLAKALAKKLSYIYVDSGAMYRAVTLYLLRNKIDVDDRQMVLNSLDKIDISFRYNSTTGVSETYLNAENVEKEIREMAVSSSVSKVSAIKEVRKKLVALQQQMSNTKGVVMDGRDIGTVVFPQAELKLFMTADNEVRVQRRYKELIEKGMTPSIEEVRANVTERDRIDTTRAESPLRKADDAIVLDNTHLTQEEQLEVTMKLVRERLNG